MSIPPYPPGLSLAKNNLVSSLDRQAAISAFLVLMFLSSFSKELKFKLSILQSYRSPKSEKSFTSSPPTVLNVTFSPLLFKPTISSDPSAVLILDTGSAF